MKNNLTKILYLIIIITLFISSEYLYAEIIPLKSLSYTNNKKITSLRKDIRKSVFTIKSFRDSKNLPDLKFYKYRVKKGENFWKIIARTSLDMDTMLSVNNISSPGEIRPGMHVYIPNMRGIIVKNSSPIKILKILQQNKVKREYLFKVNKTDTLSKPVLFIPCGKISKLHRSLFLSTGFINPLRNGRITSGFGHRRNPFNRRRSEFHKGIDLACPLGSKVRAARNGRVIFRGYKGGYGKLVIIQHELGYKSYYGHLSSYKVKKGDYIKTGDLIALSGNTGRSTGPHLHFEVRKKERAINPGHLIRKYR